MHAFIRSLPTGHLGGRPARRDRVPVRRPGRLPAASLLLAPLGLGNRIRVGTANYSHVDHKYVRDVADTFTGVPRMYYAEIYALSHRSSDYRELLDHMQAYRHWKLTRVDLTPAEIAAKRAALQLYRSQIEGLLADVPDILSDGVLGTELYWSPI